MFLPLYFEQIGRRPRYPELWRGCTHAYSPSAQGNAGTNLSNLASLMMPGTLVNMTLSDSWVSDNGYSVKPTAAGQRIVLGSYNRQISAFTMSCWVKFLAFNANQFGWSRLLDWGTLSGDDNSGIIISNSGTTSGIRAYAHGAGPTVSNFFSIGEWINAIVSIDKSGLIKVYKNGALVSSGTYTSLSYSSYPSCRLGSSNHGTDYTSNWLSGHLDAYQIYDRAISDSEAAILGTSRGIAYEPAPLIFPAFSFASPESSSSESSSEESSSSEEPVASSGSDGSASESNACGIEIRAMKLALRTSNASVNTSLPTNPFGMAAGDTIYAYVRYESTPGDTPAGWDLVIDEFLAPDTCRVYKRVFEVGDTDVTFTQSPDGDFIVHMFGVRGYGNSVEIEDYFFTRGDNIPPFSGSVDEGLVIIAGQHAEGSRWSASDPYSGPGLSESYAIGSSVPENAQNAGAPGSGAFLNNPISFAALLYSPCGESSSEESSSSFESSSEASSSSEESSGESSSESSSEESSSEESSSSVDGDSSSSSMESSSSEGSSSSSADESSSDDPEDPDPDPESSSEESSSADASSSSVEESSSSSDEPEESSAESGQILEFLAPGSSDWEEVSIGCVAVDLKLKISYDHPAILTFSMLVPQHETPIPFCSAVRFHDFATGVGRNHALFEGHAWRIDPAESNRIEYTCYDATALASRWLQVLDGPADDPTTVPRAVWNVLQTQDPDYALQQAREATVGQMVAQILEDLQPAMIELLAAPETGVPYVADDLAAIDFVPQDKVVLETTPVRDAVVRLLENQPNHRMLFHPGSARRKWRIIDVLESDVVTLTLNDTSNSEHLVLSASLHVSIDRRYGAVRIVGPPITAAQMVTTATETLIPAWTEQEELNFTASGPNAPGVGYAGRRWQVADPSRRRMPFLSPVGFLPDLNTPGIRSEAMYDYYFAFSYNEGFSFGNRHDAEIDRRNGYVTLPTAEYKLVSGEYRLPDEVRFWHPFYIEPLQVRCPEGSEMSGTIETFADCGAELLQYDEALGTQCDFYLTQEQKLEYFERIACEILRAHKDIAYAGGVVISNIDYQWRYLDKRVSFDEGTGVDIGHWNNIKAPVTEVEYDYSNASTTLTFNSDLLDYLNVDPEALKEQLKIASILAANGQPVRLMVSFG